MISKRVIAAGTPVTVVSRSCVMSLIITFMFEPAKLQMNWASASGARKRRRDTTGSLDPSSGVMGDKPLHPARGSSQATTPTGRWGCSHRLSIPQQAMGAGGFEPPTSRV